MYLAKITITLRKSILDPQGKAVEHAISTMKVGDVTDVRMGKYVEMKVGAANEEHAKSVTDEICRKLLANPIMEDYHFAVEKL